MYITVAPQKLICPHGRTYPRKAVIIARIKIVTPLFHVSSDNSFQQRGPETSKVQLPTVDRVKVGATKRLYDFKAELAGTGDRSKCDIEV